MRASRGSAGLVGLCYIHMELGGAGEGTVRDNRKTLLLTTKCLPDQTVPTGSLPLLHMCTYQHTCTHPYTWRCPHMHTQILIHAHTHATHECDFLGTYSHMST